MSAVEFLMHCFQHGGHFRFLERDALFEWATNDWGIAVPDFTERQFVWIPASRVLLNLLFSGAA